MSRKIPRNTRKKLHRAALRARQEAKDLGRVDKRAIRDEAKAAAKVDAALEGCEDQ